MRSSRVSLRPATTQRVGVGDAGEDVGLADLPAARRGHGVGQPAGQLGHPLAGRGQQVQHAELGEHDLVPVGPGADDAGQPPHPVGERAGAGVDEAGGEVVPRGVAGQRGVGEAGAQAVVEPAVELDEAGPAGGRCARRAGARGRRGPSGGGVGRRRRSACVGGAGVAGGGAAGAGGRLAAGVAVGPRAHAGRRRRPPAPGPCTHMISRARACLHGCDRLGQVQRQARWAWSTIVS